MPTTTAAQRHKVNRDPITDAHVILLEFQEDGNSTVHRAAINNEDVTSNGDSFVATDIEIALPNSNDQEPSVDIAMDNIDREIGKAVNRARNRVGCRIMLVDTSAPDTALMDTLNLMVISSAAGDSERVSASLGPRASLQEPWPPQRTRKQYFPGLWFTR
jgi:hypothetical protein